MRHKHLKIYAVFLLGLGLTRLQAQEVVTVSGGDASGSEGSVSYSIGQVVYTTASGTNGSIAQGVQQPFEISVLTGLEEPKGITLQFSVYPNPANEFVILRVENYKKENMTFQLYDINGKLLENKKIEDNETSIVMNNFVPATYFLKVFQKNKEKITFKIIKK
jgi:hypothetical protein